MATVDDERGALSGADGAQDRAPTGQIPRAVALLEAVAVHGASTAKALSDATGIPLPTVYRIAKELI